RGRTRTHRSATMPRGALPGEWLPGYAPRPSLRLLRPSRNGTAAPGIRHTPRGAPRPSRGPPRRPDTSSGIHPTEPMHGRDAVDRQHVGGDAGVHLVLVGQGHHVIERLDHDLL